MRYDNLLIIDSISPAELKLTDFEREIFIQGTNEKYWETLKPNTKDYKFGVKDADYKKARSLYYKFRSTFLEIADKHDLF